VIMTTASGEKLSMLESRRFELARHTGLIGPPPQMTKTSSMLLLLR
jgi:hypothetical protein